MKYLTFDKESGFSEIDLPARFKKYFDSEPGASTEDTFHKDIGWAKRTVWPSSMGEDHNYHSFWVQAFDTTDQSDQWKFMVEIAELSEDQIVLLRDIQSLIQLFITMAPVFSAHVNEMAYETKVLLEKWFRAEHGHEYYNACPKCDPHEYENQERLRLQFAREKRERDEVKRPS